MKALRAIVARRTWLATIHVVLDLLVSIVTFTVIVTLLALTAGLAVTFVLAVPVAWLLVWSSMLLGRMERARAAALLDVVVPDPHRPLAGPWLARLRTRFTSRTTWKEIAYHLLLLPIGVTGASLVISAWASSVMLVALPGLIHTMPDATAHFWLFDLSGAGAWLAVPVGIIGLLVTPWIARGWARLDVGLVRSLLGPGPTTELEARVEALTTTRALAVDAAEEERRRIERDLHDGAQQRLVALAMDIGMARAKFDQDPDAARALLDEAHVGAKEAIAELRDLARGIHPVALTDRGLPGAIPELAVRAPVPVDVSVDLDRRPSAAIEGIAYFVVSEALTNAVKHSGCSKCTITIERSHDRLRVTIADDGRGGADPLRGTGIRGLADRVAAVDGTLRVDSPGGGPTVMTVDLPFAAEVAK